MLRINDVAQVGEERVPGYNLWQLCHLDQH